MLISSLFTFPEVGGEVENGGKKSIKSFAGHCTLFFFVFGEIQKVWLLTTRFSKNTNTSVHIRIVRSGGLLMNPKHQNQCQTYYVPVFQIALCFVCRWCRMVSSTTF